MSHLCSIRSHIQQTTRSYSYVRATAPYIVASIPGLLQGKLQHKAKTQPTASSSPEAARLKHPLRGDTPQSATSSSVLIPISAGYLLEVDSAQAHCVNYKKLVVVSRTSEQYGLWQCCPRFALITASGVCCRSCFMLLLAVQIL